MNAIVWEFEHSLGLPFFGIGMKTDTFQSCGHCWVFQIYWHTECSTFTASSFRIWNSSIGIPSPPLALFVVMLSKVPSHSRMSGSRWVITPSWLSGPWRSFLYRSSPSKSCRIYFLSSVSFCAINIFPFPFWIQNLVQGGGSWANPSHESIWILTRMSQLSWDYCMDCFHYF